ncbi:MAG: sensor histidine kinase, partial [Bacteroidota bacterium]
IVVELGHVNGHAKDQQIDQRRLEDYLLNSFFLLCLVYLLILGVAIYVTKFHYYWFYFAYAFLGTFVVFSDLGLGFRYFWPDNSYLQQIILLIIVNLYLVTGTFFVRHHFDTAIYYERIDKVLKSIIGLAVLVIPFSFFMPYISIGWAHWVSRFQNLLIISTCLTFFYLLFRAITGSEIASSRLFLFGFSLHGISVIVSGMQDVGLLRGGSLPVALMEMDIPLTFYTQVSFMLGMLLEMGVIFYIAIRRFRILFQVFQEHAAKQQKNMNALVLGIEGERQRIAQDLHDGLGVMLSSAKMRLNLLKDKTDDQQLMEQELDGVIRHIDQSHQEVRQISHNLMPKSLYKLGFDAAVQEQIHRLEMLNDKIKIKLYKNISFEEARQLAQTYLFRIVQELLNNIFRHAHATEVNLQFVRLGEQLLLTAEDNGIGFDLGKSQDKGIGMKNIDYRVKALGGTLRVDSSPGKGCVVSIEIPLDSVF